MSGQAFFRQAEDALIGFLPPELRDFGSYTTARTLKIWYGDGDARREHFEIQSISRSGLRAAERPEEPPVLEVGFHTEHKDAARNDAVLDALAAEEGSWRAELGDAPEAGDFLGRQTSWRRLSELWTGPSVEEPEAAIEAAERLADYIRVLVPLLRKGRSTQDIE